VLDSSCCAALRLSVRILLDTRVGIGLIQIVMILILLLYRNFSQTAISAFFFGWWGLFLRRCRTNVECAAEQCYSFDVPMTRASRNLVAQLLERADVPD